MADDTENAEIVIPEENSGRSEINRKKIIMIMMPLLLVLGAAVGIYFSGVADDMFQSTPTTETTQEDEFENEGIREVKDTVFYDLPELIVNLNSKSRKQGSLMRVKIALEIEKPEDINRIESVLPRVTDTFLVHMREVRPEELDGSAGVYRLKEELLSRVNRAVRPAKVYDIRFKQFEIQ